MRRGVQWILTVGLLAAPALANGRIEVRGAAPGTIRLTRHAVEGVLRDELAEVTVEQEFASHADRRAEGVYLFALPPGASVSTFEMTVDGRTLRGEVVERGRARRVYEDIVSRQRDPALLEKLDHEVFRARVFPIDPGKPVAIRLVYQQLLDGHDGELELRYPLARARLQGEAVARTEVRFRIGSSIDLLSVHSPSHPLTVERIGPRHATVSWSAEASAQERDLRLLVRRDPDAIGMTLLGRRSGDGPGTFVAILSPPERLPPGAIPPRDLVYVLDTSGSMEGDKLAQAKAALRHGIGLLRPVDRFRVIAFSTSIRAASPDWLAADTEGRRRALAWIDGLAAGGGTALDEALATALHAGDPDRLGLLVLLTDGLPTVGERSPTAILERVAAANRGAMRVFCFGVGFDQGVPLLDEIARTTRASREYVTQAQDLEAVLTRFFDRIQQPALSDLRIDWGPGVEEVYPRPLPDLFAGDRLVVVGRYATPGPRAIRLHGTRLGEPVERVYEGTLPARGGVDAVDRLWAQRKIDFLLAEIDRHGGSPELKRAVVELATRHHVVTRYTAGLVVEDTPPEPAPGLNATPVAPSPIETEEIAPEAAFEEAPAADAPWIGPTTNSAIGIGGGAGMGGRRDGSRRMLRAGGGSGRTETAVERNLTWLAQRRNEDTGAIGNVEETSWALLAMLGAGYTDRGSRRENPLAGTVRGGLRFLMTRQADDGSFGDSPSAHVAATTALCEAYALTRNPRYRKPAQQALDHLARTRRPQGAWAGDGPEDTRLTVEAVMALRAGKLAGLEVDPDAFEGARLHLDRRAGSLAPEEEAAALLAWILLGEDPRTSTRLQALAGRVVAHAPRPAASGAVPVDLWHYGTLALFQTGGAAWKHWNRALVDALVKTQRPDGGWPLPGPEDDARVADQAKLGLCLEVYYRYDRVFGTRR